MTVNTTKGSWKLSGINLISSDSIFIKVKEAIEAGNLSEKYLQKITGHLAPITIDFVKREICFARF